MLAALLGLAGALRILCRPSRRSWRPGAGIATLVVVVSNTGTSAVRSRDTAVVAVRGDAHGSVPEFPDNGDDWRVDDDEDGDGPAGSWSCDAFRSVSTRVDDDKFPEAAATDEADAWRVDDDDDELPKAAAIDEGHVWRVDVNQSDEFSEDLESLRILKGQVMSALSSPGQKDLPEYCRLLEAYEGLLECTDMGSAAAETANQTKNLHLVSQSKWFDILQQKGTDSIQEPMLEQMSVVMVSKSVVQLLRHVQCTTSVSACDVGLDIYHLIVAAVVFMITLHAIPAVPLAAWIGWSLLNRVLEQLGDEDVCSTLKKWYNLAFGPKPNLPELASLVMSAVCDALTKLRQDMKALANTSKASFEQSKALFEQSKALFKRSTLPSFESLKQALEAVSELLSKTMRDLFNSAKTCADSLATVLISNMNDLFRSKSGQVVRYIVNYIASELATLLLSSGKIGWQPPSLVDAPAK